VKQLLRKIVKGILKYPAILFDKIFLYIYYRFSKKGKYKVDEPFSKRNNKVLFISPHVDDETIGAGGTLLKHAENGDSIVCIYIADGGGAVSTLDKDSLIQLRKKEAEKIKDIVGMKKLYFLGIPDGQVFVKDEYIDKINSILKAEDPDIIYTPFLLDGHIDHLNSTRILIESIRQWDNTFENIYMYSVNTPIKPDVISNLTIMDKSLFDKKNNLYTVFKSQYVMGFDAFAMGDRMKRLLAKKEYALEGFVKSDIDTVLQFNRILVEEKFNPDEFRQLSSRYNLFFSFMKHKKTKYEYMDIFKELSLGKQEI
jgi:LmbE family N-acetylglucosaminyl deacetylase